MDEPNAEKDTSLECSSIPGRSWPGASFYKSLKLGWHWRQLRWAVVAASEAAQGHEANGLPPGSREFKTLFNGVAHKVQEYSTESGDPLDTLKARLWRLGKAIIDSELVVLMVLYAPALLLMYVVIWLTSPFKNKIIQVSAAFASILAITHLAGVVFEAVAVLGVFAVDLLTGQVVARMDKRERNKLAKAA